MQPRIVEVRRNVLDDHDRRAAQLRARFAASGTTVVNLVSSPGTGKTALLTETLAELSRRGVAVAALVGDCATENDATRLAASGAPVRQIVTEGLCHLEADMIAARLDGWDLDAIDILFIENVGNLVCPSSFDLGEAMRIVLLSVTEGEDKPLKYPQMFHSADIAVITKTDLAEPCEFDEAAARSNIDQVHPGIDIVLTSARQPESVAVFADEILARSQATTQATAPNTTQATAANSTQATAPARA